MYALGFLVLAVVIVVAVTQWRKPGTAPSLLVTQAIAELEEAVADDPDDPDLLVRLAELYSQEGMYGDAEAQVRHALLVDEAHPGALKVLGDISVDLGRYHDALTPYLAFVALNESSPMRGSNNELEEVYYQLGVAYINLGEHEQAVGNLEEALSINPTDADALYMMGSAYKLAGECETAVEVFNEALRFVPLFAEVFSDLEGCYRDMGDGNLATYARGMLSLSNGAYGQAASALEETVAQDPELAGAYFGLGLSYEGLKENERAIQAYERAYELDEDLWLAQQRLIALTAGALP